ncbi:MAG TPA: AAA family ATPase [Roseiarcus sp.]|nr:AAA family ATPase [Roseiarcus sp.]
MMREASTTDDQSEVFSFLSDPKTHGTEAPVFRIDTHGAVVFLAGGDAYKVKRAVRFPFMDFSTLEKRRAACEAEIVINKPNAPDIYIGVAPIVRTAGGLRLGGHGPVIEWAVRMRRFDEEATLDRVADREALSIDLIARLVRAILRSHERAPRRDGAAATEALKSYLDQNEAAFAADPELFDGRRAKDLARDARAALAATKDLMIARGEAGYVRRCHGDLHLRNIALIDGEPILFDAVEFDDAIATGDVLYDLAFLLMDFEERGLRRTANLVLNRYLWATDEAQLSGLAALPIFLSIRSAIRAKVVGAGLRFLDEGARARAVAQARRYFRFAEEFLKPQPPRLVAIGGLSGTGKSALAGEIAPFLGRPPGSVWLRSDIERKRLFGVGETEHLSAEAYNRANAKEVYLRLRRKAALALKAGQSVVVDAVHSKPEERDAVQGLAKEMGVPFAGLWLDAPLETRLKRVARRKNDASDADAAVAKAQIASAPNSLPWRRLDASDDLHAVAQAARSFLGISGSLACLAPMNSVGPIKASRARALAASD